MPGTPSPTPAPPRPPVSLVNDSYVREPAVLSLDSATYGTRTFQMTPSIARVGKRLWVAWVGDTKWPTGEVIGNFGVMVYSDDGGKTWSREFYYVPVRPDTDRVGDPRLWVAPDGKLWVFYMQNGNSEDAWDGQGGVWVNIVPDPLAATPTFAERFWIGDGFPEEPFLYNGKWILPTDYHNIRPRFPQSAGLHMFEIDWAKTATRYFATIPSHRGANITEPAPIQLKDGGLLVHLRTTDGTYQRTAPPGTLAWSEPTPFTGFPTPTSRSSLARSPSGRLVMVMNKDTDRNKKRYDMTIALSDDEGKTWPHQYTFDNRVGVSYPEIEFDENGDILVVYDFGRWYGQIMLARFDEQSIVNGAPRADVRLIHYARRLP